MSSTLPQELKDEFDALHKDRKGRYRCVHCSQKFPRAMIHIDHRKPEFERPDLAFDLDNLDPLCIPCHKIKTAKEARRRARQRTKRPNPLVPLLLLAAGLAGLRYLAPDLVPIWLPWAPVALAGAFLALHGARWWAKQAERPTEAPGPSSPPSAVGDERVVETVRDVVGPRGSVAVEGHVPEDFTICYSGTGFEDHKDDRRLDLVTRLSAKLGQRLEAKWDTKNDSVHVLRRPDLPTRIEHPGFAADRPWQIVPVAPGIEIDFRVTSHVLVIGPTNTGKTVVIRNIVEAFVDSGRRQGADVRLADPKMIELLGFRGLPGISVLAATDEELWQLPIDVRTEMDRRYSAFRERGTPLDSHRPMLVLIDEYEEFVDRMEAYWPTLPKDHEHTKKSGMKNPCIGAMKSVLRLARKANIHVVIGTQRPDASWFGGNARDNLQGRIGVGRLSADAARMCFGSSEFGRDVPLTIKGRLTVQTLDDTPIEAQGYWVPDRIEALSECDEAILERLGTAKAPAKI